MAELTPQIADQVEAACRKGAADAGKAISKAFGTDLEVSPDKAITVDPEALPEELDGSGLALVATIGKVGAALLFPESIGVLPPWYREPDATGKSVLETLAQELSVQLLPDDCIAEDFQAGWVSNLHEAIRRGGVADGAALVPLALSEGNQTGMAALIWPVSRPDEMIEPPGKPDDAKAMVDVGKLPAAKHGSFKNPNFQAALRRLPGYTRSLLRIRVPVTVTLASKKQPVGHIVELGPGAILQFDKACDEMLDLEVGRQPIGVGETVKVGDKFGLRITSIVMPEERFKKVTRPGSVSPR